MYRCKKDAPLSLLSLFFIYIFLGPPSCTLQRLVVNLNDIRILLFEEAKYNFETTKNQTKEGRGREKSELSDLVASPLSAFLQILWDRETGWPRGIDPAGFAIYQQRAREFPGAGSKGTISRHDNDRD